jgi:hypothetical protein
MAPWRGGDGGRLGLGGVVANTWEERDRGGGASKEEGRGGLQPKRGLGGGAARVKGRD